jgi:N-acetylglucosamine-6-phosphate deacetylase
MNAQPIQLSGIACRRLRTPQHILDNVYIEFEGPRISIMGDFNSAAIPPGAFNAREDELTVVPGFVDVHVHGAGGIDFLNADLDGLKFISGVAARGGATTMVATTTLAQEDKDLRNFAEFIRNLRSTGPLGYNKGDSDRTVSTLPGTRITGIHLEGPFLNPERRGAFTDRFLRPPDPDVARKVMEICGDLLLKVTMAPEMPGGEELVEVFTSGPTPVEVSLGHTTANYALGMKIFENPHARQITHVFNAMTGLHHRAANLITAALMDPRISLEIIGDGLHVAAPVVQLLHRITGAKRLIAITDGASAAGAPAGSIFEAFSGQARVGADSGVRRINDNVLVGSAALMSDIFNRLQHMADIPFEDALLMCTENPAVSINRADQIGTIDKNKRADFAVLRNEQDVVATIRDGMLVYQVD